MLSIDLLNADLVLQPAATLQQQTLVCVDSTAGFPNASNMFSQVHATLKGSSMTAQNTREARARVQLTGVATIMASQGRNAVNGLLDTTGAMPVCANHVGKAGTAFSVFTDPGTQLRVQCLVGDTILVGAEGTCLLITWPKVSDIFRMGGNGGISILPDPKQMPNVFQLDRMFTNKAGGFSTVVIRLSQLESDMKLIKKPVEIRGRLPFAVPAGKFVVVVTGCGANARTFQCSLQDKTGRKLPCRFDEKCTKDKAIAKRNILAAINSNTPCAVPA